MKSFVKKPLALVGMTAGMITLSAAPALADSEESLKPRLECVWTDGKTWTALWGYQMGGKDETDFEVGEENYFTSVNKDQGQPTHFVPGHQRGVFATTFTDSSTWVLNGRSETATTRSERCRTQPLPVDGNAVSGAIVPLGLSAAGLGVLAWIANRRRDEATA